MDKHEREALAKHVLSFGGAQQTEVLVMDEDSALTRFTHNAIHQNVASTDCTVSVRAIWNGRTGVARTNKLDDESLHATLQRAIEIAKFAPRDANDPTLPGVARYEQPTGLYDAATASAGANLRAQIASQIFAAAEAAGHWSAGFVTTSREGFTVANSGGTVASFDATDAALNVKMNSSDSTGYAESFGRAVGDISGEQAGDVAAQKASASRNPKSVDPGDWTVILEPAAFGELFSYITDHFSAQSFDEGSSFFSEALGQPFMGENVDVMEDFSNPLYPGMPFDYEGAATQKVHLISKGCANAYVTDSYWASKLAVANTGHALPAPNAFGPMPRNIVVSGGSKSTQDLIAETKRGLLVSRFWYIRPVDQRRTIVTGMTRDGTFLIENGRITGGVRNLRFNQSITQALRSCEFSNQQARTGSYSYSLVVPTVKLERFHFSSGTDF